MKTVKELGKLVKAKHPEYEQIPDDELGRLIQAKYPNAYTEFLDTSLKVTIADAIIETDETIDRKLSPEILTIIQHYQPGSGILNSWIKRLSSKTRGNHLVELNAEQQQFVDMILRYEGAVFAQKKSLIEYQRFLVENQFHLINLQFEVFLREEAARMGIGIDGYLRIKEAEAMSKIRIAEHLAVQEKPPDRETEAELARIRTEEYRTKKEIDHEFERKLAESQLEFEITANHLAEQKQIEYAQSLIDKEHIVIGNIKARTELTEETKERLVNGHLRIIKMYEEQQDEAHRKIIRSENKNSDL